MRAFVFVLAAIVGAFPAVVIAQGASNAHGSGTSTATVRSDPKPLTEQERANIVASARSHIYNLRQAGVKNLSCSVELDWPAFFTQISGKPLDETSAAMRYLRAARLTTTTDLTTASASWVLPASTELSEQQRDGMKKMTDGLVAMLDGFWKTWNESLNGTLVAEPKELVRNSGGYLLTSAETDGDATEQLDPQLRVTHLSFRSTAMAFEGDLEFSDTAQGRILTRMIADYRQPIDAPSTHMVMTVSFGEVEGIKVPSSLDVSIPNVIVYHMKFTDCSVGLQHAPADQ